MKLARHATALLLWAATLGPGVFAQGLPTSPETLQLRGVELRYVLPDPLFDNARAQPIKALYVNAWAFGSSKLAQLVRLADSTEINAFVVDIKDDTGCLLYPSEVKVAQEIGATKCVRTKDVGSRLDTLRAHDIYAIARIVVAKDPLLAEHRTHWSVQNRDGSGLWRDRIGIAWVDAYNDSVWIYAAQLGQEAVRLGFNEVQFDYVRFPDEPKEAMAEAVFAARKPHEIREQIRAAEELGIDTWVLWNPRSVYQRDSLRPYRDQIVTITGGAQ